MKTFRTIEISDPRFERDHVRCITVKTSNLRGRGDIVVFVPPGIENRVGIPVVMLLHGVYGSTWSWPLKSGVHLHTVELIRKGSLPSLVLAMPSDGLWGDGSGYVPHDGYDFEKWIAEDVPAVLQQQIPSVNEESLFFISGLSMGGFGALKIGAKYPKQFRAFTGHSSITHLNQMKLFVEEDSAHYAQSEKIEEDVFKTIVSNRQHLPHFQFDCGRDDPLIEFNRKLHTELQAAGIAHQYAEFDGGHEWSYWEKHIMESLLFFKGYMRGERNVE